jgi:hypothetical protein
LDFGRAYADSVVDVKGGFQVVIDGGKVVEAVADGNNAGNLGGAGFLDDHELLDRIIDNKAHMGVSIKVLHGFSKKRGSGREAGFPICLQG